MKWVVDPEHSSAGFSVRYLLFATVNGRFKRLGGVVYFDPADLGHSSVEMKIDVRSIDTGNQERDNDLCSPAFFDAERHPAITFKSLHVEAKGSNRARITGNLIIRGIAHSADFEFAYSYSAGGSGAGGRSLDFRAQTVINREAYGMLMDKDLEAFNALVGKDVRITLDVRLVSEKEAA